MDVTDPEKARLRALHDLNVLDTAPEAQFDALASAAAAVCGVPISLVSLVDQHRQWFKARVGLPDTQETPREVAFCNLTIRQSDILEVPDAQQDERFKDNPLVTGAPAIRFYAGAPLRLADGSQVGTLCVIDRQPRRLSADQRKALQALALVVVQALEARQAALGFVQSEARFRALSEASPLGVFATDAEGACTYTNERWQAIYGMSLADSLGTGWALRLHPEDRPSVFQEWQHCADHDLAFDMDFRVQHADGTVRQVRAVARAMHDAQGALTGHVGSVEDITEPMAARALLDNRRLRLEAIIEGTGAGTFEWNLLTDEIHYNERWAQMLGYSLAELGPLSSQTWRRFCHPDDQKPARAELKRYLAGEVQAYAWEVRMRHREGHWIWVLDRGRVVTYTADGQAEWMYGTHQDITERVEQHRALAAARDALAGQHELLRVTLQSIGDAVITTDSQAQVTWLNPVAERLTGWLNEEAKGRPLDRVFHIVHEETRAPTESPVLTCLEQGRVVGLANHTLLISKSGLEYGIEDSAAPIRNDKGDLLGAVLVFHDVTEQRRLSGEMSYRASHDALTDLVNRAEFELRLRRTLNQAHEERSDNALLYIDLDQFKLVNDACGHSAGDQLLQQVAKLLTEAVRARDTLARLGGDEFAVILEHCSSDQALRVAQKICDRMDDFRFVHDGRRFRIGASIGLVPLDARWVTPAALMQAADTSCYAAKEAGRNRVHAWFDTDQAMRTRHGEMQWASRLEQAIDDDRFVLHAQRIQPLRHDRPGLHAEVLLRLLDDQNQLVPPGAFLPAAERFNLSSRIDRWVLRQALDQLNRVPNLASVDTLCVNLSGQSVGDRAFHRHAMDLLRGAGAQLCKRLCLEITETAAVTNMADAVIFVEQVRALGVRVALDDFGAGASSFGYLKTLGVDMLKIDGQFIKDLVDDPLDDVAVRCFVEVAQVLGLVTVAEFVDRAEVLQRVRDIGVDHAQGYLLHRPEALDVVLGLAALAGSPGSL